MDVMLYEVFAEEKEALRRHLPKRIRAGFSPHTIQAEQASRPAARLISTRTQSVIPLAWEARLSGVLTRSSGFDHLVAFRNRCKRRIACGYLPSYCARAVAEHALLMILALARGLKRQLRQFASFDRENISGFECRGRAIVVIGVGNLGTEIAALAASVGMRVMGIDLVERVAGLKYVTLEEGIEAADAIVCALPLTNLTKGMLNYEVLRHAKPGALFVNISRGEISPFWDLKRLLDEKILGGLALDVYEDEQTIAEHLRSNRGVLPEIGRALLSLREEDRVLFTPHNAFNTREALEQKANQTSEAIVAFLQTGSFPYPVPEERAG